MLILYEYFDVGFNIWEICVYQDIIIVIDFDVLFGIFVSVVFDDMVKVWDLNVGCCIGSLEGYMVFVRILQVEDNILVIGFVDVIIKFWDFSRFDYDFYGGQYGKEGEEDDDVIVFENFDDQYIEFLEGSMCDCELFIF